MTIMREESVQKRPLSWRFYAFEKFQKLRKAFCPSNCRTKDSKICSTQRPIIEPCIMAISSGEHTETFANSWMAYSTWKLTTVCSSTDSKRRDKRRDQHTNYKIMICLPKNGKLFSSLFQWWHSRTARPEPVRVVRYHAATYNLCESKQANESQCTRALQHLFGWLCCLKFNPF